MVDLVEDKYQVLGKLFFLLAGFKILQRSFLENYLFRKTVSYKFSVFRNFFLKKFIVQGIK